MTIAQVGTQPHAPHAKYERLIARAMQVPAAKTDPTFAANIRMAKVARCRRKRAVVSSLSLIACTATLQMLVSQVSSTCNDIRRRPGRLNCSKSVA